MSKSIPQTLPKLKFKKAVLITIAVLWGYVVPWLSAQGAMVVDCWFNSEAIPCDVHPDVVMAGACVSAILAIFIAVIALERRGYAAYLTFAAFAASALASIFAIVSVVKVGDRTVDILGVPIFLYTIFLIGIFVPLLFFPIRTKWKELCELYRMTIGAFAVGAVFGGLLQFSGWLVWTKLLGLADLLGNYVVAPSGIVMACGLWAAITVSGEKHLGGRARWLWLAMFAGITLVAAATYGHVFAEEHAIPQPAAAIALACLLIVPPFASSAYWNTRTKLGSVSLLSLAATGAVCCVMAMLASVLLKPDLSVEATIWFVAVHGSAGILAHLSTSLGERTTWIFGWKSRLDDVARDEIIK